MTDTQCKQILAHLRKGWSITPMRALNDYDCFRLAARIRDLRAAGHNIGTKMMQSGGKRFACYYLMKRGKK